MSENTALQKPVVGERAREPSATVAPLGVVVRNDAVAFLRYIESFLQKNAAADAIRRMMGMNNLAEELEVYLANDMACGYEDIVTAAVTRLTWNIKGTKDSVQVKPEHCWVKLTGSVRWYCEKEIAASGVRHLADVTCLSDQVTTSSAMDTIDFSGNIIASLHCPWFFGPRTVTVTAGSGEAPLSGTVQLSHE